MVLRTSAADQDDTARELFLAHRSTLLPYLNRVVGDAHHGEDVLQEVMIKVHRYAARLWSDDLARRAWLFRVGHNIAVDHATSASRRVVHVGLADERLDVAMPDPAAAIARRIDVTKAVRRLSPAQRRIIFEVYYQGHTVASAAATIGISPSTAQTHLSVGLRRLRLQLTVVATDMERPATPQSSRSSWT